MVKEPKPSRGMPRALLYALIPAGFLIMVAVMVLSGRDEVDTATEAAVEATDTVPQPVDGAPGTEGAVEPAD